MLANSFPQTSHPPLTITQSRRQDFSCSSAQMWIRHLSKVLQSQHQSVPELGSEVQLLFAELSASQG